MGGPDDVPNYWMNGKNYGSLKDGVQFPLAGFPVKHRVINDHQRTFRIDLGHGEAIMLQTYKDFVRVDLKTRGDTGRFGSSLGLMGTFPNGVKLGRDNMTVYENSDEFGKEWQVQLNEPKLFHEPGSVEHPTQCIMPSLEQKKERRRRLGESSRISSAAQAACRGVDPKFLDECIFDVAVTNDVAMAMAYFEGN